MSVPQINFYRIIYLVDQSSGLKTVCSSNSTSNKCYDQQTPQFIALKLGANRALVEFKGRPSNISGDEIGDVKFKYVDLRALKKSDYISN